MVTEGIEPSTVALLAQRSNQLSYATCLPPLLPALTNSPDRRISLSVARRLEWPPCSCCSRRATATGLLSVPSGSIITILEAST